MASPPLENHAGSSLIVPESPVVLDSYDSPEPRQESTFRPQRTPSFRSYEPRVLTHPTPESVLAALEGHAEGVAPGPSDPDARAALVLQHALRWAIEHDMELLGWLTSLGGRWGEILKTAAGGIQDEDGWGLVGMSIQASCGRDEREEGVRAIVSTWGMAEARDKTGWTPLHLAALISTPPLVSFLLTRGAPPHATTNRGLTPLDLVSGMEGREDVALLLEQAALSSDPGAGMGADDCAWPEGNPAITDGRRRLLKRRRDLRVMVDVNEDENETQRERREWIRERVKVVGVDPGLIGEDSEIPEDEPLELELVFAPHLLPGIFDTLITRYPPAQPLPKRGVPANTLYLYARFALLRCDDEWLEELLEGAVEKIEQAVYAHVDEVAHLAFWSYNATLLLHLLTTEEAMRATCDELGLLGMVEELVNAIHVFVIRVAERQIDTVLDGGMLDYETLDEVGDVRFEGEWALFKTLGKKQKSIMPRASQIFSDTTEASPSGLFNSLRGKSPFKTATRQQSLHDLRATFLDDAPTSTPTHVTDILTGVLVVLRTYGVNPALTIQAFSQIFFWIACELFNRILTRKKYLCRSRAVQIRMNITALEDWVRTHGIPPRCAAAYLEPVLQLIQWLQCQSSVGSFGDLIGTTQGLRALNPLQMRKALREYRYEVNEGRMEDESALYLGQLQKDWERRRVETSVKVLVAQSAARVGDEASEGDGARQSDGTPIDALFDGSTSLAEYEPARGPECYGELLDSRFMLPFQLPDEPAYLVAAPDEDWLAGALSATRPGSRSSFSSARAIGFSVPSAARVRALPDDFFTWLRDEAEARKRRKAGPVVLPGSQPAPAPAPTPAPLGLPMPDSDADGGATRGAGAKLPVRITTRPMSTPAPRRKEDDTTPTATMHPVPLALSASIRSPGSGSMEQYRERGQLGSSFRPTEPMHARSESYELQESPGLGSGVGTGPRSMGRVGSDSSSGSVLGSGAIVSPTASMQARSSILARDLRAGDPPSPSPNSASGRGAGVRSPSSGSGRKWWSLGRKDAGPDEGIGMGEFGGGGGRGGNAPKPAPGEDEGGETIKASRRKGVMSEGFWERP